MPRIPSTFRNLLIDTAIRQGQPGSEDAIFPRTLEDAAVFIFSGRPLGLQWGLTQMVMTEFLGTLGFTSVMDTPVGPSQLRYYHAVSAVHTDPAARNLHIEIVQQGGAAVQLTLNLPVGPNIVQLVDRPIVLGEDSQMRAVVNGIAGGQRVTLRTYSSEQGLASDLPGL